MLTVFNCWDVSTPAAAGHSESLFQTGWFVESLLTQTLIIHIIRTNKGPSYTGLRGVPTRGGRIHERQQFAGLGR